LFWRQLFTAPVKLPPLPRSASRSPWIASKPWLFCQERVVLPANPIAPLKRPERFPELGQVTSTVRTVEFEAVSQLGAELQRALTA